ncbi:hypothetical protein BST61_g380 [Cercospora zeina]
MDLNSVLNSDGSGHEFDDYSASQLGSQSFATFDFGTPFDSSQWPPTPVPGGTEWYPLRSQKDEREAYKRGIHFTDCLLTITTPATGRWK